MFFTWELGLLLGFWEFQLPFGLSDCKPKKCPLTLQLPAGGAWSARDKPTARWIRGVGFAFLAAGRCPPCCEKARSLLLWLDTDLYQNLTYSQIGGCSGDIFAKQGSLARELPAPVVGSKRRPGLRRRGTSPAPLLCLRAEGEKGRGHREGLGKSESPGTGFTLKSTWPCCWLYLYPGRTAFSSQVLLYKRK